LNLKNNQLKNHHFFDDTIIKNKYSTDMVQKTRQFRAAAGGGANTGL